MKQRRLNEPIFAIVLALLFVPAWCRAQGFTITTVAGDDTAGYSGDGGPATSAQLNYPQCVAVDASGNLYIADSFNNVVREVAVNGAITTVAGNGTFGYSGDGGPATGAQLAYPHGLAFDSAGNLYIADTSNDVIREVSGGVIMTIAGSGSPGYTGDGGQATSATLYAPYAVVVDAAGDLYITDSNNHVIRQVLASTGNIATIAGNGYPGYSGDGGPLAGAQLNYPKGLAFDSAGNLYITDFGNNVIRKVSASGIITTVAGNGTPGYLGDGGAAAAAELAFPESVAPDATGNLYIADTDNQRIREVSVDGTISTVAGNGTIGYAGDGGPGTSAEFFDPKGVAVGAAGDIYVADWDNNVIRLLTPDPKLHIVNPDLTELRRRP